MLTGMGIPRRSQTISRALLLPAHKKSPTYQRWHVAPRNVPSNTALRYYTATPRNMIDKNTCPPLLSFTESLRGKSYLVTGGGRGIGYAITRAVAECGANVTVLDALPEPVPEFHKLASEFGVKTKFFRTDVTNPSMLESNFERSVQEMGGLHGCVTAAGIVEEHPFTDYPVEKLRRVLDVNVVGTFLTTQLAAKHFIRNSIAGSIVLIASVSAHMVTPNRKLSAYASSKAAVRMLTTAVAAELGSSGIRVNCISPGYINTDLLDNVRKIDPDSVSFMDRAPHIGRIGQPKDISAATVYLLSDAAGYSHGSEMIVDGGVLGGIFKDPRDL
ncbi:hypothetical protein FE257_001708 [Aspergillus nanangensis]|uniref:Ketoreductase domain-containing protein n=1 Tax=Aspergillus nanangensis TaxID=2582783 RepID=A0AAD4CDK6_ASPNN|nr:hypothetical protein FE257_001708 [Aspergillus nanangensis]